MAVENRHWHIIWRSGLAERFVKRFVLPFVASGIDWVGRDDCYNASGCKSNIIP
jgi:hypothetical protein